MSTDRIIEKSKKDYNKLLSKPTIRDIVSLSGFLKYTYYRNMRLFIKDILMLIIFTLEVYLINKLAGKYYGIGGILGYFLSIFLNKLPRSISYLARSKLIVKIKDNKNYHLINFIGPFMNTIIFIWLLILLGSYLLINNYATRLIVINRIITLLPSMLNAILFTVVYTYARIYISMKSFISIKLLSLILEYLLFKYIGIYAFIFGMYFYETIKFIYIYLHLQNTMFGLKLSFSYREYIKYLFKKSKFYNSVVLLFKTEFYCILLGITGESLTFLSIIIATYTISTSYVIYIFMSIQILRLFTMIATRLSRSIFFDSTKLLIYNNFSLLKLYITRTLTLSILLGILIVYIFYLTIKYYNNTKYFYLLTNYFLLDKWQWLYILIFSYYIFTILKNFFIATESYSLLSLINIFTISSLILSFFLYQDLKLNPLLYFPIYGKILLLNSILMLFLFQSNLWHLFSKYMKDNRISIIKPLYYASISNTKYFAIVYLKKIYIRRIGNILAENDYFLSMNYYRVSPTTLVIGFNTNKKNIYPKLELLAPFANRIELVNNHSIKKYLLDNIKLIYPESTNLETKTYNKLKIKIGYIDSYPYIKTSKIKDIDLYNKAQAIIQNIILFSHSIPLKSVQKHGLYPLIKHGRVIQLVGTVEDKYLDNFITTNLRITE